MASAQKKLIRCAKAGDAAGVEEALEGGAWVDHVGSREGRAGLHYAAADANLHLVHLLLAYTADPNVKSDATGEEGATPLHLAAYIGRTDVINLLVTSGADGEVLDDRGKTAVHWAALQGQLTSLDLLKKHGCDLGAKVSSGGNTLHYAAASGNLAVVQWLVECGVSTSIRDKNNWLPKEVAKRNGHSHIHSFLKKLEKRSQKQRTSRTSSSAETRLRERSQPHYRERSVDVEMASSSSEWLTEAPKRRVGPKDGRGGGGGVPARDIAAPTSRVLSSPPPVPPSPLLRVPPSPAPSLPPRTSSKGIISSTTIMDTPPPRKKKWVTLRSKSTGVKAGLKLQVLELKEMLEQQEDLLQTRTAEITNLQEKIFAIELEKTRMEEQLQETSTRVEEEQRARSLGLRTNRLQRGALTSLSEPTSLRTEERLREVSAALEAEREDRARERLIRREELQEANSALEAEKHLRTREREAKDAEIAALTSLFEEATAKMRRYGVRQRKCLTRSRAVDDEFQFVGVPSGLPNLGNTCYINSVVQCLFSIASLREYFTSDAFRKDLNPSRDQRSQVTEGVVGVFKALRSGVRKEIENKMLHFKDVAEGVGGELSTGQQPQESNAHLLLVALLSALHRDLLTPGGTSFVSDLFYGNHESTVTCDLTGEVLGQASEEFTHLSLPVPAHQPSSLWAALTRSYGPQSVEWDCPQCRRSHLCRHQTTITHLPPVLVIHINRPCNSHEDQGAKVQVTYPPRHLTLQDHARASPSYELVGVVSHHGTLNSGHYTAFCRSHSDPTWRLYDDHQVVDTSLQRVLAETDAYLLVYGATTS